MAWASLVLSEDQGHLLCRRAVLIGLISEFRSESPLAVKLEDFCLLIFVAAVRGPICHITPSNSC